MMIAGLVPTPTPRNPPPFFSSLDDKHKKKSHQMLLHRKKFQRRPAPACHCAQLVQLFVFFFSTPSNSVTETIAVVLCNASDALKENVFNGLYCM